MTRLTRLPDVTEGYATSSKSYSTGNIFSSAKDTLREIFPYPRSVTTETPPRKRARPHSDKGYDEDQGIVEDDEPKGAEMALYEEQHVGSFSLQPDGTTFARPIKPLRRTARKGIMTTRSLPGGSMRQLDCELEATSDETMNEEEDWSLQDVQASSGCSTVFEPMILS
jgi:hypothetical protein